MAQWVSRAPLPHTLPAFVNLNGTDIHRNFHKFDFISPGEKLTESLKWLFCPVILFYTELNNIIYNTEKTSKD